MREPLELCSPARSGLDFWLELFVTDMEEASYELLQVVGASVKPMEM